MLFLLYFGNDMLKQPKMSKHQILCIQFLAKKKKNLTQKQNVSPI